MTNRLLVLLANLAPALILALPQGAASTSQTPTGTSPRESRVAAGSASLYARDIGRGRPLIVLHGGPDFDHAYLLPDLDRLASDFRLIYYDQRGRGLSADGVQPEDVTLASDIDDVDRVREHFQLTSTALLGHSWGAVLALEYALRHPDRVSHLILMNPAPASMSDLAVTRKFYLAKLGAEMERQREIVAGAAYLEGDPEAVIARYRIHFRPAFARSEDFEKLMTRMREAFRRQGKSGIVKARAVEDRLMAETWNVAGYDLVPKLGSLRVPTVVIWGDHDFIPLEISTHITRAIPDAQLITLKGCGHFAYLECVDGVRKVFTDFFRATPPRSPESQRAAAKS